MSANLSKKVLCVNLKTSCLGSTVTDAELTAGLRNQTGAEDGAVRATKKILEEATKPMRKLRSELRRYLNSVSLPGISDDLRIVTPKRLEEITKKLAEYEAEDAGLVSELAENYDAHKAKDKARLGTAYDEALYPPVENLPQFFTLRLTVCDLPQGDYFRVEGLTDEAIEKLKQQHEKTMAQVQAAAKNEVHKRFVEMLRRIADNLAKEDISKLHNTTFDNLIEFVDQVPDLNITNDPQLEAMRVEVKEKLNFTMAQVKASAVLKEKAQQAAKEILTKFGGAVRRVIVDTSEPDTAAAA